MLLALVLAVGGLTILTLLLLARAIDAQAWRENLTAYRLTVPAKLSLDDVSRWLGMVAAATQTRKWALQPDPPMHLEVVARAGRIEHYVLVSKANAARLLGSIRTGLPGARLEPADDFLSRPFRPAVAGELATTSRTRPLAVERAEATSVALLGSLQPLHAGEEVRLSVTFTSAGTPEPVHHASPELQDQWWSAYLTGTDTPVDADTLRAARTKHRGPLLQTVVRLGISSPERRRAEGLLGRTWSAFHNLNAPGVRLIRRWLPAAAIASRMRFRKLPLTVYPLVLNIHELAPLLALPVGGVMLPGLPKRASRQLPPPNGTPRHGIVLADATFPGMEQPLALGRSDSARHTWLLGPTGTGKSALLANIALQYAERGSGLVLVDPKSDLVEDVLARMPADRRDDVVVIDPAATDHPVGLNILGSLRTEADRERAVDHVVHIMASLWKESFGPRSSDIVRSALLTLANTTAPDGSNFTLAELPEILQHKAFRRYVTGQATVPAVLRPFWFSFEQHSDSARDAMLAAPLNKLRTFSTRSSLRLLLGQSGGFDIADVFNHRKRILLVKLSKGTIGIDTAKLFGSLVVASTWNAVLGRAAVPPEQRRSVGVLIDEFQDVLRMPSDLADFMSQARSLNAHLYAANQFSAQLPEAIRTAALGTIRTTVAFQVDHDDAALLARRYAPMTADDLMAQGAFEVAVRLSVEGQTQAPITAKTRPLPAPLVDPQELAEVSQKRYGQPRSEVEAGLKARISPPGSAGSSAPVFGRKTERRKP